MKRPCLLFQFIRWLAILTVPGKRNYRWKISGYADNRNECRLANDREVLCLLLRGDFHEDTEYSIHVYRDEKIFKDESKL
jgi:hypothetical protein